MEEPTLSELRKTAIEKIRRLVDAVKQLEEPTLPPEPASHSLKEMMPEVFAFIDKQPLESAASAAILGALTERIVDSNDLISREQIDHVKDEAQRIIRTTVERIVSGTLQQGITIAAVPLAKMILGGKSKEGENHGATPAHAHSDSVPTGETPYTHMAHSP